MAREVENHAGGVVVSRQVITQLETCGDRQPHYILALAKVMGTSADRLLTGLDAPAAEQRKNQSYDRRACSRTTQREMYQ